MAAHPIITLLATAFNKGLSRPIIKIRRLDNIFKIIYVTKAAKPANNGGAYISKNDLYLGWLSPHTQGIRWNWDVDNTAKAETEALLIELDRPDLKDHLAALGRESGCCCFCGLELTNEGSIHYGYGPICAGRWGLPWTDHYDGDASTVDLPTPEDF